MICGHESQSVRTSRSLDFVSLCCSPFWCTSNIRLLRIHEQGLSSSLSLKVDKYALLATCRMQCLESSSEFVPLKALRGQLAVSIFAIPLVYGRDSSLLRCLSRKTFSRTKANAVRCRPQTSVRVSHRLLFT